MSRRTFLKSAAVAVVATAAAGRIGYGVVDESNNPVVEHITIPVRNLARALEGFTIVQLTDLHLYPFTRLDLVNRCVRMANDLQPGLTVVTGDYVWQDVEAIHDLAPALAGLDARHGVFTVLGNHDYWTDVQVIKAGLTAARLPLLVNQGVTIQEGGSRLHLAGLDDGWAGHPDLAAAMQGAVEGDPVVLLLHEPDLADEYSRDPRIALQLAGHSHGGQVRTNRRGAFVLPYLGRKYDMGLYRVGGMWVYTNRGIGCISVPLRVNCAPEVTSFTLVSA